MEFAGLAVVGIAVGVLGALLGIGGGMVIVPLLVFGWGDEPQMAIGTSVLVVLLNALSGTWGYIRQRKLRGTSPFPYTGMPKRFNRTLVSSILTIASITGTAISSV